MTNPNYQHYFDMKRAQHKAEVDMNIVTHNYFADENPDDLYYTWLLDNLNKDIKHYKNQAEYYLEELVRTSNPKILGCVGRVG